MRRASIRLLVVAAVGLVALSCNPVVDDNRSAVYLTAAFDDGGDDNSIGFISDVVADDGFPVDDLFEVTVTSTPKGGPVSEEFYTVQFLAYDVNYTRPDDGQNEPGVGVPFPFTVAIGGTVSPGGTADLRLWFVFKEAKLQPPLRNLWFGDGERIFATVHTTIYGRDRVENSVSASAAAPVLFEDQ